VSYSRAATFNGKSGDPDRSLTPSDEISGLRMSFAVNGTEISSAYDKIDDWLRRHSTIPKC